MLATSSSALAEPKRVTILLSNTDTYIQTANTLREGLTSRGHVCTTIRFGRHLDSDNPPAEAAGESQRTIEAVIASRPDLVVTIGSSATAVAVQVPLQLDVIYCLVPNALDRPSISEQCAERGRMTGIPADLAPEHQVEWIQQLTPQIRHLGVFHSPRSRRTVEALAAAAEKVGLAVSAIPAGRENFADAVQALTDRGCDGVLMVADAEIYQSANVQRLLLWGLRGRRPVWAFSPSIVRAGALAGLYVDNEAVAEQVIELVDRALSGENVFESPVIYTTRVHSAWNERTAELIGRSFPPRALAPVTTRYSPN